MSFNVQVRYDTSGMCRLIGPPSTLKRKGPQQQSGEQQNYVQLNLHLISSHGESVSFRDGSPALVARRWGSGRDTADKDSIFLT